MLKELLEDYESGHSKYQIDNFIVNVDNTTPYARYKQSLREIDGRHKNMLDMLDSLELQMMKREELSDKLAPGEYSENTIKLRKLDREIETQKKVFLDTLREFSRFYQHAVFYKQMFGNLAREEKDDLERDIWVVKTKKMIAEDMKISKGQSISGDSIKMLHALDPVDASKMEEPKALMEWRQAYMEKEDNIMMRDQEEIPLIKAFEMVSKIIQIPASVRPILMLEENNG